ncbi:MAG: hypothetical protein COV59_00910 [Candidatus Magasanikbacteria bacterium CG11_big_fil_rev_8_21_14_0_20_39_34]|uniref:NADH:ubiquinone reductase (non-electrogenic) n=1 Tax=Candidatus Magasanikbacteria bacterium CG11_big_fil_rev_8_21_14_0_20_39_34 TaxID=1974653 RepID=A0A2H0N672_9BACT|nr:MAG: hypothetical protein COV59_00910 [Candidatus Magasanikbacteria bacterium CG11_big_fil_rev_8_21_14_0_20_39_34]
MQKKRIVILGAGFAGIYTYKYLHKYFHQNKNIELVLVNKTSYFLFTPLLHEVATGGISSDDIVHPIRESIGCCLSEFHETEVESVSCEKKIVKTKGGDISYDYLVISLGSQTNSFGIPGVLEHSYFLKTLEDAFALKNQIIDTIEKAGAVEDKEEKKRLLTYAIIGGGPTGIELATEISEFIFGTLSRYYKPEVIKNVRIFVIQATGQILPGFPNFVRVEAEKALKREKIELLLNTPVEKITKKGIFFGENCIETETAIWTAGVSPVSLGFDQDIEKEKGKIVVEPTLQVKNQKDIFVLGDMAYFPTEDGCLPALAQVAVVQAKQAAKNIVALINGVAPQPFSFHSKGILLSLGKLHAAGTIGKLKLKGPFMWWVWRTIYWMKLITWKQRIKVGVDWAISLFMRRDINRGK